MRRVYLPVEVKKRAWTAKLFLASMLVDNGFEVVIGSSKIVLEKALEDENGIYVEKDFYHLRYKDLLPLVDKGFFIYAYDEEGLVTPRDKWYIASRVDEDTLGLCKKVFLWGEKQELMLRVAYPYINNLIAIGNPRIDLISSGYIKELYSYEIKEISKFGRYILINSNFCSNGDPRACAMRNIEINRMHEKEDRISGQYEYLVQLYTKANKIFDSLHDAIKFISPLIDCNIVIRVHPSESMDKWEDIASLPNVSVVSKYDANPWIYCSEGLIHFCCTTSVEAYLMGKPVISYTAGLYDENVEKQLPESISVIVNNREELMTAINNYILKSTGQFKKDSQLKKYLTLKNGKGIANEMIIQSFMNDIKDEKEQRGKIKLKENLLWDMLDPVMKLREKHDDAGKKFQYESKRDISRKMKIMKRLLKIDQIKVKHIGRNAFYLHK